MTGIRLSNEGDRLQKMTADQVKILIERWESELNDSNTIEILDLQCRSYPLEGTELLCSWLSGKVDKVEVALLNDIIASLPTEEGLAVLECFSKLLQNSPLKKLDLSDNAIGSRGVERLKLVLSRPTLTHLYVRNDGLSAESMKDLGDCLLTEADGKCAADHLQVLEIYNNMAGIEGARVTGKVLERCVSLIEFEYQGCRPQPEGTQALVDGLLKMGQKNKSLKKLVLEGSLMEEEEDPVTTFAEFLKTQTELQHLRLYDCSLGVDGTKKVCRALSHLKNTLVHFDVSQNDCTAGAASHLALLLTQNASSLKFCDLSNNDLTSVGIERLVDKHRAFEGQSSIEELRLRDDALGHRAASAVMKLASLASLKKIDLGGEENAFEEEVVEQLKEAFGERLAIDDIEDQNLDDDLDEEDIPEDGDEVVDQLAAALGSMGL